jgi:hypothetical protein
LCLFEDIKEQNYEGGIIVIIGARGVLVGPELGSVPNRFETGY